MAEAGVVHDAGFPVFGGGDEHGFEVGGLGIGRLHELLCVFCMQVGYIFEVVLALRAFHVGGLGAGSALFHVGAFYLAR